MSDEPKRQLTFITGGSLQIAKPIDSGVLRVVDVARTTHGQKYRLKFTGAFTLERYDEELRQWFTEGKGYSDD